MFGEGEGERGKGWFAIEIEIVVVVVVVVGGSVLEGVDGTGRVVPQEGSRLPCPILLLAHWR